MRPARAAAALILVSLSLALTASPASATFHEISTREVYAGSAEHPNAEYVELQMWSSGQNFVGGHDLLAYGPAGSPKENFLASDVPAGACVSWGSFGGSLPSPAGTPAAAIPAGMALRRTIAPGCATLPKPTDARDNSAADFSPVSPSPRPTRPPRASAPVELRAARQADPMEPVEAALRRRPEAQASAQDSGKLDPSPASYSFRVTRR